MVAFISYSLVDSELFVTTLLSNKLRAQGYSIMTNRNLINDRLEFTIAQLISSSQLFIGLISYNGQQRNRVLQEWNHAIQKGIPTVLLIEDNVPVADNFTGRYVRFNRRNPQPAIDNINRLMSTSNPNGDNESLGWLLAGAALLGILALFGSKK